MTRSELNGAVKAQVERIIKSLDNYDPGDISYHTALRSIEYVLAVGGEVADALDLGEQEAPVMVAEVPYEEPEMPHEEPSNVVQMAEAIDRIALREALAKVRMKGIDINPLLQKYGADRFNAVPEARYAELMADVRELL